MIKLDFWQRVVFLFTEVVKKFRKSAEFFLVNVHCVEETMPPETSIIRKVWASQRQHS